MIIVDRVRHERAVGLVEDCLAGGRSENFEAAVTSGDCADPFAAILDQRVRLRIFDGPATSLAWWLEHIDDWRRDVEHSPLGASPATQILFITWDHFSRVLSDSLQRARVRADLPLDGGVLAYVAGLSTCIVVDYEFSGPVPELTPVAVIDNPRAAFDLWAISGSATTPRTRNRIKNIVESGHKVIAHAGTLIHVDRRTESTVSGPSIDTLVLAEILRGYLTAEPSPVRRVLEVGSGSGMLSASVACHAQALEELFAIDTNFRAVACTDKNLNINAFPSTATRFLSHAAFECELFPRPFDLIVCNPPYIPDPPDSLRFESARYRASAVAGLSLVAVLLRSASTMLTESGRMLLMASEVSLPDVVSLIPRELRCEEALGPSGFEVPFDVDAAFQHPSWVEQLVSAGRIRMVGGSYVHALHPLWLSRA